MKSLKVALDLLLKDMSSKERIPLDPILFPGRFKRPEDIEVAGLIASALAYGKVELFLPVLDSIFRVMGDSPQMFCSSFDPQKDSSCFDGIYYRFNTDKDIATLVFFIGTCLRESGSLSNLFLRYYSSEASDVRGATKGFLSYFRSLDPTPVTGESVWSHGLKHIFPSPDGSSPLKRFNLFLRWMVRKDRVDFGVWEGVSPSKLIIPLDTHILRVGYNLGLTKRKVANMATALEITSNLLKLDSDDPVKYDFALCHLGISGRCPHIASALTCKRCVLTGVCNRSGCG